MKIFVPLTPLMCRYAPMAGPKRLLSVLNSRELLESQTRGPQALRLRGGGLPYRYQVELGACCLPPMTP